MCVCVCAGVCVCVCVCVQVCVCAGVMGGAEMTSMFCVLRHVLITQADLHNTVHYHMTWCDHDSSVYNASQPPLL